MRLALASVLFGSLGLAAGHARAAFAATCDAATLASARAAVVGKCDCTTATNHKDYVRCVLGALKDPVKKKTLSKECARAVHKCAAKSTCGTSGFVTCCETSAKGTTKCSVKRDATACKPPHGGSSCVGSHPSCCDACATSGCAR